MTGRCWRSKRAATPGRLAPILPEAWEQTDTEARRVLTLHLGGRKLVDFDGPHGWVLAAVNMGRLELLEREAVPGVRAGVRAIFLGYPEAGIIGMLEASPHPSLMLPTDPTRYPHTVVDASEILRRAGTDGPYALALGPQANNELAQAAEDGYPVRKRVAQIITGPIVWSPALEGAVLLSTVSREYA